MMKHLKKPGVQFLILLVVGGIVGGVIYLQKTANLGGSARVENKDAAPPPKGMGQKVVEKVPTKRGDVKRALVEDGDMEELNFPKARTPPPPDPVRNVADEKKKDKEGPRALPSLVHFDQPPPPELALEAPRVFGPRGLLIRAALVLTLDSSSLNTPVLAMVTEDVYWNGDLLVPAGTQVFAQASDGKVRDRIEVAGTYTFVWADGREYKIAGIALDHDSLDDESYSLTDGSAGIRGQVIKTDQYSELKLLIAELVSGLAANSQQTFQSVLGPVPENTASNSAFAGISTAGERYAELMLSRIETDLTFVRVPAGQTFYIFTEDVFEPNLASVAGAVQGNEAKSGFEIQREAYSSAVDAAASESQPIDSGSDSRTAEEKRLERQDQERDAYLDRVTELLKSTPGTN